MYKQPARGLGCVGVLGGGRYSRAGRSAAGVCWFGLITIFAVA